MNELKNEPDMAGYFINLDISQDRRESMEQGLSAIGLGDCVKRFSAIKGDTREAAISRSELGCFLSHQHIIENAIPDKTLIVMEDDLFFPKILPQYLKIVLSEIYNHEWDILYLTQMISFSNLRAVYQLINMKRSLGDIYGEGLPNFSINDCKNLYVSSMAAYIIAPNALSKVSKILQDAALAGYRHPIDIVLLSAINQNKINAKFVFPYLFGVDKKFLSTIQTHEDAPLHNEILNLFVAGGDIDALKLEAYSALHQPFDVDAFIASQIIYRRLKRRPVTISR